MTERNLKYARTVGDWPEVYRLAAEQALQQSLQNLLATYINPLAIQLGFLDQQGAYRLFHDFGKAWGQDPAHLHREYAKARSEFQAALIETVQFHLPQSTASGPRCPAHKSNLR